MKTVRKAVITAAGWGTRFLPVTKSQPKEMLPLINKPLIQFSVEEAAACGIETVIIITALGKRAIEDHFDRSFELETMLQRKGDTELAGQIRRLANMVDMCFVRQKEQLGLGHAVLTARSMVGDEPFVLMLPDDVFEDGASLLKRMLEIHGEGGGSVLALAQVPREQVTRYGIVDSRVVSERVHSISGLVEKPSVEETPSNLAIMGRYVLSPGIFASLEGVQPSKNGEIQLTDGLRRLLQTETIHGYEFDGQRYDGGTPLGLLEASAALALKDPVIGPEFRRYLTQLVAKGDPTPPA
jgi:UTP--glucose-1-phosphate uridylyltransferase